MQNENLSRFFDGICVPSFPQQLSSCVSKVVKRIERRAMYVIFRDLSYDFALIEAKLLKFESLMKREI